MDFYLFFFLFVFHKEFLVISHNFNDQVYTIIIAQPNLDNQIGAIERVDINPQPLKEDILLSPLIVVCLKGTPCGGKDSLLAMWTSQIKGQ